MDIQKLLVIFIGTLLLTGCSTSVAKKPYFKDHIGVRRALTEKMCIGKVKKNLPIGITDVVQKNKPAYIMFKEDWISFFEENDVFEGPIVHLKIDTPVQIEDMIYLNNIDSTGYYACGKVCNPTTGTYVPFQYRLDVREESEPNKRPSKIMRYLFRSKRSETSRAILEKMPWEKEGSPEKGLFTEVRFLELLPGG